MSDSISPEGARPEAFEAPKKIQPPPTNQPQADSPQESSREYLEAFSSKEVIGKAPLDAVIVCGMGPAALLPISSERLFPRNPFMRLNAFAAKLVTSNRIADRVIVSGTKTAKPSGNEEKSPLEEKELATSEAEILADTYDRMRGRSITPDKRAKAAEIIELDHAATTTFDNIFQGLNILDEQSGGYWEGSLGVISSEFHMPRIAEMIEAFGLASARPLSAEQILRHFGYEKLYPTGEVFPGKSFAELEEETYQGQPAGLQNLQDNPAYVTFELAKVKSDKRLQEIAANLKQYYVSKGVALPAIYDQIPQLYDPNFSYAEIREGLSKVSYSKHAFRGEVASTQLYRVLAKQFGENTTRFLNTALRTSL